MGGVRVPVGSGGHLYISSRPALGPTQPRIQCIPLAFPPGLKWPQREADHSLPTSAEVKKTLINASIPLYISMA
jgi:hypothetical protein